MTLVRFISADGNEEQEVLAPAGSRLLDIAQHSVAEVARLTGRTRASVKVRAFRARRKLRNLWQQLAREDSRT